MNYVSTHRTPPQRWRNPSGSGLVFCSEPNGLGDLQVAECANGEIARTVTRLFNEAPKSLREAVLKSPLTAAAEVLVAAEVWASAAPDARPASPWFERALATDPGNIRSALADWYALPDPVEDLTPMATGLVRAFVRDALDAAEAAVSR